jgi:ABC-2 type transport system permease protein
MLRGFIFWYTATISLLMVVFLLLMVLSLSSSEYFWEETRNAVTQFWTVYLPVHSALLAALSVRADQGAMRFLLSYPIARHRLFTAKFLALAVLTLASQTVVFVLLAAISLLWGGEPVMTVAVYSYLPWLVNLGVLALLQLVATLWGIGVTVGAGIAGLMLAAVLSGTSAWVAIPFTWAYRSVIPLVGINSNGLPLEPGSPLWDNGAIPVAIVLAAGL